jgi:hypothetical protein
MNIGVTGHQNLISKHIKTWVRLSLSGYLSKFNDVVGFTCLADGADQIFAEEVLKKGFPLTTIIPSLNYEKSFSNSNARINFHNLVLRSNNIIKLNYKYPCEEAYLEAGKTIVFNSDILFAIWDGKDAKGLGGTADIVNFAKVQNKIIFHFDIIKKSIIEMKGLRK